MVDRDALGRRGTYLGTVLIQRYSLEIGNRRRETFSPNAWQIHNLSTSKAEELNCLKLHEISKKHASPPIPMKQPQKNANTAMDKAKKSLKGNHSCKGEAWKISSFALEVPQKTIRPPQHILRLSTSKAESSS
ncbi:hypothetical protein V6N12_033401 [Hibiscus sabdariffa]|uniref:Uncharacterized protein n=1 Tax=Hibiscus sabdariffa TaxID=183260 RepID=A0ABR2BWW6_9ROSI